MKQLIADLISAMEYHVEQTRPVHMTTVAIQAAKDALKAMPAQEPVAVDATTMELAESVGLIGPASRTHDLHAAIQRFHDLICANATLKAAKMAADAISEATPPKREWVGLTDEEIHKADPLPHVMFDQQRIDFARAIEAKLKERNA